MPRRRNRARRRNPARNARSAADRDTNQTLPEAPDSDSLQPDPPGASSDEEIYTDFGPAYRARRFEKKKPPVLEGDLDAHDSSGYRYPLLVWWPDVRNYRGLIRRVPCSERRFGCSQWLC
ncbi:hypothetical protein BHE90_007727 [Fusarium euwallaceae]|uniref:Uncharacterized protein n=1 Tax=Fusarium euwallaceae TaxID=1147111 RepID=A0A430LQ28_9HYPO|nr:hypothetical protein BHE90_007727 [Fusarium euwallaceae]